MSDYLVEQVTNCKKQKIFLTVIIKVFLFKSKYFIIITIIIIIFIYSQYKHDIYRPLAFLVELFIMQHIHLQTLKSYSTPLLTGKKINRDEIQSNFLKIDILFQNQKNSFHIIWAPLSRLS